MRVPQCCGSLQAIMKKISFSLAVIASLISSAAMADVYVSGAVGSGHVNADCTGVASCDNNGTAFKLTGGYAFANGISVEMGYIDFGKASANDSGVSVKLQPRAITLAAAYKQGFTSAFYGTARLGVASMKASVSGTVSSVGSASDSKTTAQPYFGLGLGYSVTPTTHIELAGDFTRAEYAGEKASVRALTIGVRHDF